MNKDWKGDSNSVYKTLGSSNHCEDERQNEDYYATDPEACEMLLKIVDLDKSEPIWECASGENHLADVFKSHGYFVRTSDIMKRTETTEVIDFLSPQVKEWNGNIITNPPYNKAKEFIEKSLSIVPEGKKVIMFLKLQFLEGKSRKKLFQDNPPKEAWVSSSRLLGAKNGDFETARPMGSAVAYCWYIWEKGYKGDTILKWFN